MLSQLSWSFYFKLITVVVITYYSAVFLLCYSLRDLKTILSKLQIAQGFTIKPATKSDKIFTGPADNIKGLIGDIKDCIQQASKNCSPKDELMFAVHKIINAEYYRQADIQSFRNYINDFISKTTEQYCSIHLSEEDLRVLWI